MSISKLIVYKFLSKQLIASFVSITSIIFLIIFGNQFFLVLSQSLNEGILTSELFPLMSLKVLRDLPFIIGLGFTLSLIFSLNRLYKSSEIVILNNAGLGEIQIFKILSTH